MSDLAASARKYNKMILKIQRPLFTNEETPQFLIYNEDRTLETFMGENEDLNKLFKDEPKQYWLCSVPMDGAGYVELIKRVEDQEW